MVHLKATILVLLLVGIAGLECQTPSAPPEKLTFENLIKATRVTLRDSAELPMEMKVSLVASDATGSIRKLKNGSFQFDFHGFNPRSGNSSWKLHGNRSTTDAAMNSSLFVIGPIIVVDHGLAEHYTFDVTEAKGANSYVGLKARPNAAEVQPFDWSTQDQLPNKLGGVMNFEFEKEDLSLHGYILEATGLPINTKVEPFGKCTLLSYRMNVEFQTELLEGDPKPFLIPKRSITTIETNKGKVVIDTYFALRQDKKK